MDSCQHQTLHLFRTLVKVMFEATHKTGRSPASCTIHINIPQRVWSLISTYGESAFHGHEMQHLVNYHQDCPNMICTRRRGLAVPLTFRLHMPSPHACADHGATEQRLVLHPRGHLCRLASCGVQAEFRSDGQSTRLSF